MNLKDRVLIWRQQRLDKKKLYWEAEKQFLQEKAQLESDQQSFKNKKKKVSTSKKLITFLFINCTLIEIFTGYVTLKSFDLAYTTGGYGVDFSPLISLIGAVVGEVIGFAIYAIKSSKENSQGGIVYEMAMLEQNIDMKGDD